MTRNIVSILCPSYNHGKFVGYFINSLMTQTSPDWELIIVDDCSSDNNVAEIRKFQDRRIKFFQNPFNMGINCCINTAMEMATGKYLALCASDDILCPNYIENVLNFFDNNPEYDIFYPGLKYIDNNNHPIKNAEIHSAHGDNNKILRELFFSENVLTSPGMVFRRTMIKHVAPLDIAMSQHQDYQLHVKLLLNGNCFVSQNELVLYRRPSEKSGLSYITNESKWRVNMEESAVMDMFLKIHDVEKLHQIFGKDVESFGKISDKMIPYVLGNLALKSDNVFKKMWGHKIISGFINNIENYKKLNDMYGFCFHNYLNIAKNFAQDQFFIKYKKYKKLFNISIICIIVLVIILTILSVWG